MESVPLHDCAGRRRSPATLASFHRGHPPRNKGLHYPPDPPTVEEIITVMRAAGTDPDGSRLRGLMLCSGAQVCGSARRWRFKPESDLDADCGAILVRRGKGGKRREVGMDRWAWAQLALWLAHVPPCLWERFYASCAARPGDDRAPPPGARVQLRNAAQRAGVRRRFAPHQLRHAHAIEMSREGVPIVVIQRQLGPRRPRDHFHYLRGIDNTEIIHTVHERPIPMIPATAGLRPRI